MGSAINLIILAGYMVIVAVLAGDFLGFTKTGQAVCFAALTVICFGCFTAGILAGLERLNHSKVCPEKYDGKDFKITLHLGYFKYVVKVLEIKEGN